MFSSSSNAESWCNNPVFAATRKQRFYLFLTYKIHSNSLKRIQTLDNNNCKRFWVTFFMGKIKIGLRKKSLTALPHFFTLYFQSVKAKCAPGNEEAKQAVRLEGPFEALVCLWILLY